jgi:hypothetical protein
MIANFAINPPATMRIIVSFQVSNMQCRRHYFTKFLFGGDSLVLKVGLIAGAMRGKRVNTFC